MGLASLIIGIICILMSFIPVVGLFFIIPAIVGLVLGIVGIVHSKKENKSSNTTVVETTDDTTAQAKPIKKNKNRGFSIAGTILCSISLFFILVISILVGVGIVAYSTTKGIFSSNSLENIISSQITNKKSYKLNESYNDGNIKITMTDLNLNFTDYSEYAVIDNGDKIIKATFNFENVGVDTIYASSYNFVCYADSYSCSSFWYVNDSSFSTSLSSRKKATGTVYFEVPADSKELTIEYESALDNIITFKLQ